MEEIMPELGQQSTSTNLQRFFGSLNRDINSIKSTLPALEAELDRRCSWKQDENDSAVYDTECGNSICFRQGNLRSSEYEYCPYCGGMIEETKSDN